MYEDWTKTEVALIIEDYFHMLKTEFQKQPYNKTEHRRNLMPSLNKRSGGSIERKHQNISAVLINMGLPFIRGYKPLPHYQKVLEEEVAIYLRKNRSSLEHRFEQFADKTITPLYEKINFKNILEEGPEGNRFEESEPTYKPIKINYLEREQNNRGLGEEGERLVIAYEQYRLREAGKESLADKIEWTSREKGDGAGFDILSKNINGTDRFVEVKTTKLSKETPIYLSKTEVSFASLKSKDFYLYRVFNFDSTPQIFIKNGKYEEYCRLLPQTFKGYF